MSAHNRIPVAEGHRYWKLRFNWVVVHLDTVDDDEKRELVEEAWRMVVPKRLAAQVLGD